MWLGLYQSAAAEQEFELTSNLQLAKCLESVRLSREATKGGEVELGSSRGKPREASRRRQGWKRESQPGRLEGKPRPCPFLTVALGIVLIFRLSFLICKMNSW